MKALSRIPPALPGGYVYFEMVRHPEYWKDVVNTRTLGLRIKLEQRGKFLSPQMLAPVLSPNSADLQHPGRGVRRQGYLTPAVETRLT